MNILITGGLGFIGSNMVNLLLENYEHKLVVLDKVDVCSNMQNIDLKKVTFVRGNICNSDLVSLLLEDHNINVIIHFAAETHVDKSFGNSLHFTKSNVLGTHTLLECCRIYGKIEKFIHVSTDEVYGEVSHASNTTSIEDDKLEPTNPYAATKAAAEYIVKSYLVSFGIPIIITRSNNIFGERQYPEKLIPKFITLLSQNKPCEIHGDGKNKRSYLHVEDVCCAFDLILHKGVIGETYNIGSELEYENIEIWKLLMQIFRESYPTLLSNASDDEYLKYVEDRAFNDRRYWIDSAKIEELGWKQSSISFRERLQELAKWYIERPNYWS
jgi:dTDP-glucose 4,6-dehydratase